MSISHELYESHYRIRRELDHKIQGEAYQGDVRELLEGVLALMDAARTELDTLPGLESQQNRNVVRQALARVQSYYEKHP